MPAAGVWVNDDEPGILEDTLEWLDKLAPPSWKAPANDVAASLSPDPGDFRHHRGGEDNGDAHWKNLLDDPGKRHAGNELAAALHLDKGAHGVAGILAWPGRYCRKLGRGFPIATDGRGDGGTDYFMEPEVASIFVDARGLLDAR